MVSFEKQCENYGITEEVESIINNCECGEINNTYLIDLSKLRKWEIIEVIGNYFDWIDKDDNLYDWNTKYTRMSSFCEAFAISEDRIGEWYARSVSEWGFAIAYAITNNIILIIE